MNITGSIIKELRTERNLTLEELAAEINETFNVNLTGSMICKWETGKAAPVYDHLKRLALYFNVTTDLLLGLKNDQNKPVIASPDNSNTIKKRIRNTKKHFIIQELTELFEGDEFTSNDLLIIKDLATVIKSRKHNKALK